MNICSLDSTYDLEKQMSFSLSVIIVIGMVIIGAAYHVLKRRRMRIWLPIVYPDPTEEYAKDRGVLVTGISKFPAANTLPVQQKSTDNGELVLSV